MNIEYKQFESTMMATSNQNVESTTNLDFNRTARGKLQFSILFLIFFACTTQLGCIRSSHNEVVVFVALDREFSEPILKDLEQEMSIRILAKYDQESNKTVGLVNEILQNQNRPRGDLFWNNEILHTLRLERLGLLEIYRAPSSKPYPGNFMSPEKNWYGFAARARVLIINMDLISDPADYPRSVFDLAEPKWQGKCAMAKPLFGTTATHAAVWFDHLGKTAAEKLLREIAANAAIEGGNKTVATRVSSGQYAWGITDTDDAIIELELGKPVAIIFPDQQADQMGTLLIPNTIALIKNGPNTERAKALLDRILKSDIEERLARGRSAQIPLSRLVTTQSRVTESVENLKIMEANFSRAAANWDQASEIIEAIFQ